MSPRDGSRRGRQVIVVGSGIAGLVTAIEASRDQDVLLLTKAALSESTTRYAQGGIAAVLPGAGDDVSAHLDDTLLAGAGLSGQEVARTLCADAASRVRDLVAWGVEFDRAPPGSGDRYALGLEGAHSAARILHAGGDATGAALQDALVREVVRHAVVAEHTFVRDLVLRDGRVVGVSCIEADGTSSVRLADAVVLATGGAGELFPYTTNPSVATGDGPAAALRAGAFVTDLEFYQFHPTALAVPGCALVSEAVRGEGAVLLDADGRRFMLDEHHDAELAPRDVVARGIAAQMARQDGSPVLLDATGLGADFLRHRFPGIDASCRAQGYDWSAEPVPVTPAAHYWMGGVRTDACGRTSLPGLYAVGETACTGVHGANRLASNSLLEGAVYAHRCARALAADEPWETWDDREAQDVVVDDCSYSSEPARTVDRTALQQLMWGAAGLYRSGGRIADALSDLDGWRPAGDGSVASAEDANLLDLARAVLTAAAARRESRGAHFRTDFPEQTAHRSHHIALSRKVPAPC